jgi:hypothetical protein
MNSDEKANVVPAVAVNPFTAQDVASILVERGWLGGGATPEQLAWCERAAGMLGAHVAHREGLAELLGLIFQYDAREILASVESHVALSRFAAREVLRQVALMLLDGKPLTSDRFSEIVDVLKRTLGLRLRELFYPLRLALAGRAGDGGLDRVILLLDEAAGLSFAVAVKSARVRILEFCSELD